MAYLFLFVVLFSFPALADFEYRTEATYAQEMVTSENSVIDSEESETESMMEPMPVDKPDIGIPDIVLPPETPVAPRPTKQVVKKVPTVNIKRSYQDDRIDDSYVQDLIKQKFNFNSPIE